jgi:cytochrome c553
LLKVKNVFSDRRYVASVLRMCLAAVVFSGASALAAQSSPASPVANATLKQFCFTCHGKAAMGGLNLEQLSSHASVGEDYQHWEKVVAALEQKRMPPPMMPQPTDEQRQQAITSIRTKLDDYAQKHAGDPGRVTVRRLTSGEFAYSIHDLTGVEMKFEDLAADSAGGEGSATSVTCSLCRMPGWSDIWKRQSGSLITR